MLSKVELAVFQRHEFGCLTKNRWLAEREKKVFGPSLTTTKPTREAFFRRCQHQVLSSVEREREAARDDIQGKCQH